MIKTCINMKKLLFAAMPMAALLFFSSCKKETETNLVALTANFEDLGLAAESYWIGEKNNETSFKSGDFVFSHSYNPEWKSWNQFAYANVKATSFSADQFATHQYRNVVGKGAENTATFAVGFDGASFGTPRITVSSPLAPDGVTLSHVYITNAAYTASTIKNGDAYGNAPFKQGDFALLKIYGVKVTGDTASIDFYLADYRDNDAAKHYIVNEWKKVDLRALGQVKELFFKTSSSHVNEYGNLLPSYFCLDQLKSMGVEKK